MTDELDEWLAAARRDGSVTSQAKLMSRVAGASSFALALASTRAVLALEMKLALSGQLAPWLAGLTKAGVVGGVVGAAAGTLSPTSPSPPPMTVAQADPVVAPVADPDPVAPTGHTPRPPAAVIPSTSASPPTQRTSMVAPPVGSSLAPALAVLERARGAIARGDAAGALAALERYPKHRGDGTLDPEARLLRIVATKLSGRSAEASAEAQRWLANEPDSPFSDALRAVTESPQ